MDPDLQLLTHFVQHKDTRAFQTLVERHVQMVYGVSRRQVKNAALAEDVVQAVFLLLTQRAKRLIHQRIILGGWLFQTTRLVGKNALRAERRRKRWEKLAPPGLESAPARAPETPIDLDAALARLRTSELQVVMARFYEGLSLEELATTLSISPAAAKKRLTRALGKLRTILVDPSTAEETSFATKLTSAAIPPTLVATIIQNTSLAPKAAYATILASTTHRLLLLPKLLAGSAIAAAVLVSVAAAVRPPVPMPPSVAALPPNTVAPGGGTLPTDDPAALLQLAETKIVAATKALKNISFHSKFANENARTGTGVIPTAELSERESISIHDQVQGRARFEVISEVFADERITGPHDEQTYIATFNGQTTDAIYTRKGDPSLPKDRPTGFVQSGRTSRVSDSDSGWEWTVYGYHLSENDSGLTAMFEANRAGISHLAAQRVIVDGNVFLRLEQSALEQRLLYDFDPAHGFALVRTEHYIRGKLFSHAVVLAFHIPKKMPDATPPAIPEELIYFPALIKTGYDLPDGDASASTISTSDIVINNPNLPDNLFAIQWPKGMGVWDEDKKERIFPGGRPSLFSDAKDIGTPEENLRNRYNTILSQMQESADSRRKLAAMQEEMKARHLPRETLDAEYAKIMLGLWNKIESAAAEVAATHNIQTPDPVTPITLPEAESATPQWVQSTIQQRKLLPIDNKMAQEILDLLDTRYEKEKAATQPTTKPIP